jgi:hypothetical protein
MDSDGRSLGLYDGTSYKSALDAYWQAVHTLHFLRLSGRISLNLTKETQAYGGFRTEFDQGSATLLHVPFGFCRDWAAKGWTGENIAEKMIATVPGTLGPVRQ